MAKASAGPGVQAIKATSYYRSWFNLTADGSAAQTRKSLFYNQASTDARNDLAAMGGRLPQGKDGWITAVFFRLRAQPNTLASAKQLVTILEALRDMDLAVIVNGSEITKLPIWACNHPPHWIQGGMLGATAAANDANLTVNGQNGGYMLQFQPHQVMVDQSIEVALENPNSLVLPDVTVSTFNVGGVAGAADVLGAEVAIQISDRKLV